MTVLVNCWTISEGIFDVNPGPGKRGRGLVVVSLRRRSGYGPDRKFRVTFLFVDPTCSPLDSRPGTSGRRYGTPSHWNRTGGKRDTG